ncbi:MAG: hypothetical protein R3F41_14290 [Gammaproteobacteria bacterium]|nr:hypothetical protein [Pseudomonadales bacterium]
MNWEAIAAIGELVGAIAVVVSLAYLAIQIRQNTKQVAEQAKALQLEAHNSSAADFTRFRHSIIQSPQVASVWRKGKENYQELQDDERTQADELFRDFFWAFANTFFRNLNDQAVTNDMWEMTENFLRPYLELPGVQQWWTTSRPEYPPVFVERVDSLCDLVNSRSGNELD